jgi:hypothetical protein
VSLADGYTPAAGQFFELIRAGTYMDDIFAFVLLPTREDGGFRLERQGNSLGVRFVAHAD